jgi:transposase
MQQLYSRCAGLDVHKETIVACMRIGEHGKVATEVQSFASTTIGLLALSDWLAGHGCTHVAMEATGVYWKPVWHVLEDRFPLVLANSNHIRNVPGRKSDVKDAVWIAGLLAHGLIEASFVPPTPIQQIRDLTRTRKQLKQEQSRHVQRIHKALEDANIKVTSVLTDVMGRTGRQILDAIVEGLEDPSSLAKFRNPRCKHSEQAFVEALTGVVTEHHRFLLRLHLEQVDKVQAAIESIEAEVTKYLEPFREAEALLVTMPGVDATSARMIIGELGVDMSRFPTVGHVRSWARLCPRSDMSAGKHRSTRIKKGAIWLKPTLVQCAWCAVRTKGSYFQRQFGRLRSRMGAKKAIIAVASSMLSSIYYMLLRNQPYQEVSSGHFDQAEIKYTLRKLTRRIEALGYKVDVQPMPAAS